MFTGIVEEQGTLVERHEDRYEFAADRVLDGMTVGDSIAVNGCCLTVVDRSSQGWMADISDETRRRTNLGDLALGSVVNFERPLCLDDRLGGHLVQGHVDAVGEIVSGAPQLRVRIPFTLLRYIAEKGSVAVDGVSLTVVNVYDDGFDVSIIPHTAAVTTLGTKVTGDTVNIEVDVMAKYAERLLTFVHVSNPSDL